LQGLRGPITVNGKLYSLEMPPLGILEDQQIAAILTYVRREWNNTGSPVPTDFVAKTRADTASREEPWTEADLLKIK
jgi:mono/diheme cytochrome c family protein